MWEWLIGSFPLFIYKKDAQRATASPIYGKANSDNT
jgi:hypothetical protein